MHSVSVSPSLSFTCLPVSLKCTVIRTDSPRARLVGELDAVWPGGIGTREHQPRRRHHRRRMRLRRDARVGHLAHPRHAHAQTRPQTRRSDSRDQERCGVEAENPGEFRTVTRVTTNVASCLKDTRRCGADPKRDSLCPCSASGTVATEPLAGNGVNRHTSFEADTQRGKGPSGLEMQETPVLGNVTATSEAAVDTGSAQQSQR
eukprot:6203920-Pleurochrysis_carterae.AAC.5